MNKRLIDRINHFDRFDTEKYIEVVNAKNGIENIKPSKDVVSNNFFIKGFVLVFILLLISLSFYAICCL